MEAVKQATVAAQVQGRVVEVRVDAGDRVKQGDVLMRIDERQAAQGVAGAEAQVAQSQANLANARAAYERTKNLFAQKFVSQAALDQAAAAYRSAEAQVKVDVASRGQAGTTKSFTTITSPLTGLVAQRLTELGEMASPGKPLVTVYEPGQLRVVASVPQYKLAEVQKTQRARLEFAETRSLDRCRLRHCVADCRCPHSYGAGTGESSGQGVGRGAGHVRPRPFRYRPRPRSCCCRPKPCCAAAKSPLFTYWTRAACRNCARYAWVSRWPTASSKSWPGPQRASGWPPIRSKQESSSNKPPTSDREARYTTPTEERPWLT